MEPELPPENWGDRFHRAYRIAKRRYGRGFTYREVAKMVSPILRTNDAAIIRLEAFETRPSSEKHRTLAACCLAVYGFDPRSFGLEEVSTDPAVFAQLGSLASASQSYLESRSHK